MNATVTALLVSHDGERWLPAVLDAVTAQTRPPDRVVAVDTGSQDQSATLLRDRLGPESVTEASARTPYGDAVAAGLDAVGPVAPPGSPGDGEWVWLLHDDSAPAPDALEALLAAAADNPTADVLGPKLREWPSLRRLLEVGVTISGTGRRETGLERGEYDQGQHDRLRDVLAVNTAGMLVRREVLEKVGFDRRLPVFGNDLDFGWRAARAGHRTLVVPDAVVFHVEAAHRGVRRTDLTGARHRRGERAGALYTLLVSCSLLALPLQLVRLFLGSLVRALGFLLVRAPGEALDELAALARVYLRPDRIILGRRRRARAATVRRREVRPLLAPPWLPYRHGLDFVADVVTALAHQATDYSAARRARSEIEETGPVPEEAQNLPEDTGLLARTLRNPVAGVFAVLVLAALWSARGLVGGGMLTGGALLPAPESAGHWWDLYLSSGHDLGVGSTAPAGPYLLPLALLGTLLAGKAWLVVDLLLLLVVPLSGYGGYRFLRLATGSGTSALWGGATYGLLPVLSGAVQQGRLGTVVALLVLPWVAHAAWFLGPRHAPDRRRRAAWRTALLLAVVAAFAPLALVLAALLTLAVLIAGLVADRGTWARAAAWGPLVAPVPAAFVLLLPWSVTAVAHQGWSAWLFEAGLPSPGLSHSLDWLDLVFGRPGSEGAPWWLGLGIVLPALGALLRADTRPRVLTAWTVVLVSIGLTAALAGGRWTVASSGATQPVWLGLPLLVAQAAAVTAVAIAATGIRGRLAGATFGWRQPVGAALVLIAAATPVAATVWWVAAGSGGPLDRAPATEVPTYMSDAARQDPAHGVLLLDGDRVRGFDYQLLRGPGLRLGDDTVLPTAAEQRPLTDLVARLAVAAQPDDVTRLGEYGVGFVYAGGPVDSQLSGSLDGVSGTSPASALRPAARAWQLEPGASDRWSPTPGTALRPALLVVQGLAVLTVLVLAVPSREVTR